jgi:uncharacterized protein (TIGR02598 family)
MKVTGLTESVLPCVRTRVRGFSLVEVVIAMAVAGVSVIALLSAISSGMLTMQMARENVRATQIMLEKTETLRLYSWDQLTATNFLLTSFTEKYDPTDTNTSALRYTGIVTKTNVPMTTAYSDEMKQITITLNWTTGRINRSRSFTTYVARNGLQNYIY